MAYINCESLAHTLDAVNEAFFNNASISVHDRLDVARWLAGRQGQPGAFLQMFAPTQYEFAVGARVFTGEKILSIASMQHVLGEESCRVLRLLNVDDIEVVGALARASDSMLQQLNKAQARSEYPEGWGRYCCANCTVGYWRHLVTGGFDQYASRLAAGVSLLASRRESNGRWVGFPYYYTLLALYEMPREIAQDELRYAEPGCEKLLQRAQRDDLYGKRRRTLLDRVLAAC